jgi:hypothetical protein
MLFSPSKLECNTNNTIFKRILKLTVMYLKKLLSKLKTINLKNWKVVATLSFFITGILSTLWFLLRVLPKPSRVSYPCMRTAAPIMSGFIVYLVSITGSVIAFRKFGRKLLSAKYMAAIGFLAIAVTYVFIAGAVNIKKSNASTLLTPSSLTANNPIGTATGLKPGRVVWVYNPNATNENMSNSGGDFWYKDVNTNQDTIRKMLAYGIIKYTDAYNLASAWDSLFKYFNVKHSKGSVGYSAGEKIVIKLNMTNMGAGGRNLGALMNSTPQLMLALLEELIDSVGVAQADITMGDPFRGFGNFYWDKCQSKYPYVHYIEGAGTDGRQQTQITSEDVFFTSDIDVDQEFSSRLPQAYMDAAYMINMPCMKSHNAAGITLAAKNHQGSVIDEGQTAANQSMINALHYDYPDNPDNQVYGIYRHIVDYMAHSKLGGNTLVYIVDAIWSGRNWNGYVDKWGMPPFNGDYTSSLFISQDPVATESVGYDFLFYEYASYSDSYHNGDDFPTWPAVDDYIRQAADPSFSGIDYDPDHADHSSPVGSLGVYEHWNNVTEKKYSRNLSPTGTGIELVYVDKNTVLPISNPVVGRGKELLIRCYPNPFTEVFNIDYTLPANSNVNIDLISTNGSKIANLLSRFEEQGQHSYNTSLSAQNLPKGQYICRITYNYNGKVKTSSMKIQKL